MSDQFARMGKHTPGPWIAVGDEIYGADGSRVAEAVRDIELVRAAPELLAERDALVQATGASSVLEAIGIIRGNKAELDRLTTLDVTLDEKTVQFLSQLIDSNDDEFPEVRLTSGNGHSGFGLYVSFAEYPEEGSELLTPLPDVKDAK